MFRAWMTGCLRGVAAVAAWVVVAPLAWLVPDRRGLVVVIGREEGRFADNTKYLVLQAPRGASTSLRVVAVSESRAAVRALRAAGMQALHYPSPAAVWCLVHCRVAVVDSSEWCERFRRFWLVGARVVQLWHGVGFKRIGIDKWRHEPRQRGFVALPGMFVLRLVWRALLGRLNRYAVVVATSKFYADEVFAKAFWTRRVAVLGYPRNAFGWIAAHFDDRALRIGVDGDLLDAARGWVAGGRRVLAVLPTFRNRRATPMGLDAAALAQLQAYCERTRSEMVFKFHPYEAGALPPLPSHLHSYAQTADIYPLLPLCAALITDYSSVYMDFLHVARPIVFLVPDLADYAANDRDLQFDFDAMSPGPHCETWRDVLVQLDRLATDDEYAPARQRLLQLAFDGRSQEQAADDIWRAVAELAGVAGDRG